jgi:hypothetical protein
VHLLAKQQVTFNPVINHIIDDPHPAYDTMKDAVGMRQCGTGWEIEYSAKKY